MKMARFIVDTHVHSQRHAVGKKLKGSTDYDDLGKEMSRVEAYSNEARLLYDMECYGVDMCITEPSFGMTNEISVQQTKDHPEKFAANCQARRSVNRLKAAFGETDWNIDDVCAELDELLSTGDYVGIGEGLPMGGMKLKKGGKYPEYSGEPEIIAQMMKVCEVARKHGVPLRFHTGIPGGYAIPYHGRPWTFEPLWAHTLAVAFPDVPIILEHGGIEGGWWEHFYEQCLHVASSHKHVYLETGRWWTDLYYKALKDPNVGPEKLLWGTDWGASLPVYTNLGGYPPAFTSQVHKDGIPRHQVDIWGWSLKQIGRLDISQDDLNLMLGGNAVRLYNLRTPGGLTRMFKFVD